MTLQECYAALGGDYGEVMGRLRSESLVRKFVLKFLADPSFALLESSLAAENWAEAFRGAHTLKGVCQNLSFTALYQSSATWCEALRGGQPLTDPSLAAQVAEDHQRTAAAIQALQASLPV